MRNVFINRSIFLNHKLWMYQKSPDKFWWGIFKRYTNWNNTICQGWMKKWVQPDFTNKMLWHSFWLLTKIKISLEVYSCTTRSNKHKTWNDTYKECQDSNAQKKWKKGRMKQRGIDYKSSGWIICAANNRNLRFVWYGEHRFSIHAYNTSNRQQQEYYGTDTDPFPNLFIQEKISFLTCFFIVTEYPVRIKKKSR